MSHIVTIEVEVRDLEAIRKTCRRMKLEEPCHGKATLFQKNVQGTLVRLPFWKFPIVIDLQTGKIQYDNYKGKWGNQGELNKFLMFYGAEKAKLEAEKQGHVCTETVLDNGHLKIQIQPNRNQPDETINVTFLPGGASQVETTGYSGSGCSKASDYVEKALGTQTNETWTAEYYEVIETEEEQQKQECQ